MNIHWGDAVSLASDSGQICVVTGYIEMGAGVPDGASIETAARNRLMDTVGDKRGAWSKVSYVYARHRMGEVDVLLFSAAVVVNAGK